MLNFQGFWGIFEGFSRNTEKGNCKFEPQKCNSVFECDLGEPSRLLSESLFFEYSHALFEG
jgi:hypothetical protein